MPTSAMPLIAQTVLEGAVVAWAGWEVWKLRAPKPPGTEPGPTTRRRPQPTRRGMR